MRIAICDDDAADCASIIRMVDSFCAGHPGLNIQPAVFQTGNALLCAARQQPFDLYILDIILPGLTGLALAEELTRMQGTPNIVFLTHSEEYALDAFRVWAKGYLTKPVDPTAFHRALEQALIPPQSAAEPRICLPLPGREMLLPLSSISYVENGDHVACYHLTDGQAFRTRTLRQPFAQIIAPLLEDPRFFQPHRSFLVNAEQVVTLSTKERTLTLRTGDVIPIAKSQLLQVRGKFMDFLSGGGA